MQDKEVTIGGKKYRLAARSDGRYNIYTEGRKGSLGSTSLPDVEDFINSQENFDNVLNTVETPLKSENLTVEEYNNYTHSETGNDDWLDTPKHLRPETPVTFREKKGLMGITAAGSAGVMGLAGTASVLGVQAFPAVGLGILGAVGFVVSLGAAAWYGKQEKKN